MEEHVRHNETGLLEALSRDDQQAFAALYNAYHQKLYFFVLHMTGSEETAKDALQEVFVKIWTERKQLPAITNFNAFIFRITRNHVLNGLKRMAHETMILAELGNEMTPGANDVQSILSYKDIYAVLQAGIEELPPQQKLVFRLSREEGLKHEAIARQLHISPLTVKKHVSQSLIYLREKIRKHYALTSLLALLRLF